MSRTTVGSVTIKDYSDSWIGKTNADLRLALYSMCNSIKNTSLLVVPKDSRDLARSARIERIDNDTMAVSYGKGLAYARYQEFGGDGRRVVRHYTTPGTHAHYLKQSGDAVTKRGIKEFIK